MLQYLPTEKEWLVDAGSRGHGELWAIPWEGGVEDNVRIIILILLAGV
ncbi:hypothetical protein [Paenibacillus psychroresistens]|nr:hypothetical protein [Paenibacillus psychroresistens]